MYLNTVGAVFFHLEGIIYSTILLQMGFCSLVTLLPFGSTRAGSAVVGLNDECVLLLLLAVDRTPGPQHPFTRRPVQNLCLKRGILPVNLKCTDLTWNKKKDTGGRISDCENTQMAFFAQSAFQPAMIATTFTQHVCPPTPPK